MKVIHLISGGDSGGAKTHVLSLLQNLNKTITAQLVCFRDGPFAEVMTTKVGDQEVRIGKTDYILKSEYIEFSDGTITNVIWGD